MGTTTASYYLHYNIFKILQGVKYVIFLSDLIIGGSWWKYTCSKSLKGFKQLTISGLHLGLHKLKMLFEFLKLLG